VPAERCGECGFDGDDWSDAAALEAIDHLPGQFLAAVSGIGSDLLQRRSSPDTWSIAEYVDHVREVLFAIRYVLDCALEQPGIDLGEPVDPPFSPTAREIDIDQALSGLALEANALRARLGELAEESWTRTALIGGESVDAHWVCRHAVHDGTHHLGDVRRLRNDFGTAETR
jgi:DinB superfamily